VARELETRLLGRKAVARTTDPQAYLYFLEARHHLLTNGADEYPKVRRLLEAALAIDPDYLEAWVGVSRLNFLARGEFPDRPADWPSVAKARRLSQEALDKATALDPANPAVLGFRGMLSAHDGDFVKAASYAAHAMRLAPDDPDVLFWATSIALRMRRPEIAVQLGERAVARDPRCMGCLLHLLNGYAALGRAAEADVRVQRFRVVSGGRDFWYTLGLVHLNAGDLDGALASFEHAPDRQVDSALQWHGRALALYALGRPAEAREARANFEARRRTDPSEELWIERAGLDAWMGAPDSAVATLEPPFADAVFFHRAQIASLPVFRKLDGHPAWEALLERYGIGTAQLAAIPFEIELPSDPRAGASAAGPVKDPRAPAP
jgi:tetratricopeptide (TPR) repeat protein